MDRNLTLRDDWNLFHLLLFFEERDTPVLPQKIVKTLIWQIDFSFVLRQVRIHPRENNFIFFCLNQMSFELFWAVLT